MLYYILNIPKGKVLTYRDGYRITYGNFHTAAQAASYADVLTGETHAVIPDKGVDVTKLEGMPAPWTTGDSGFSDL